MGYCDLTTEVAYPEGQVENPEEQDQRGQHADDACLLHCGTVHNRQNGFGLVHNQRVGDGYQDTCDDVTTEFPHRLTSLMFT